MKKIEAIIRPEKLDVLRAHIEDIGYPGMSITEVRGHGKQRGVTHQFRGTEYKTSFMPKISVALVVKDADAKKLIAAIVEVCRSGTVGDGKIFVSSVDDAIRIRTGESGDIAVS